MWDWTQRSTCRDLALVQAQSQSDEPPPQPQRPIGLEKLRTPAQLPLRPTKTCIIPCSGNPRMRRLCGSKNVLAEAVWSAGVGYRNFCVDCACERLECSRPKRFGVLCAADDRMLQEWPWELEATRAMHRSAAATHEKELFEATDTFTGEFVTPQEGIELLPIDVTDYVELFTKHCVEKRGGSAKNLYDAIVLAVLKEPLATNAFSSNHSVEPVLARLEKVWEAIDGCPNVQEVKQLSRQGVGRFLGPSALARALNVLRKEANANEGHGHVYKLGLSHNPYVIDV